MRGVLAKNVPAYAQIRWDKKQKPEAHLNDAKTNPREVQSIWFDPGADALLATAVYLKYAAICFTKMQRSWAVTSQTCRSKLGLR